MKDNTGNPMMDDTSRQRNSDMDETYEEMYRNIRQMSNEEQVIEPLSGGIPIFKHIKNLESSNQLLGLGSGNNTAMKNRRPFSPPIKNF